MPINATGSANSFTGYGSFISNEGGKDHDFRVESSGEPNMLFVNGGTNRVGIGTQFPSASLHVSSSGDEALLQVDGAVSGTVLFVTGSGRVGIGTSTPGSLVEISGFDDDMNEGFVLLNRGMANFDSTGIYLKHHDGRSETFIRDRLFANWGTELQFGTTLKANESAVRMTLDQSGSLGIGCAAGVQDANRALLHVSSSNDAITGSLLQIDSKDLGPVLFVTGSGRVGIGTAAPTRMLDIEGGDSVGIQLNAVNQSNAYTVGSDGYGFTIFEDADLGTAGYRMVVADGGGSTTAGFIGMGSGVGIAGSLYPSAQLHVSSSNNQAVFRVDHGNGLPLLFATGSGRVGIGTATPNSAFQVSGSQAGNYTVITGDMTLNETHYIADLTGAIDATVTLPAASGVTGRTYHILTTYQGDMTLTITGSGGQFMGSSQQAGPEDSIDIEGSAQSVTLVSTGAYWFILTDNRQQEEGGGGG